MPGRRGLGWGQGRLRGCGYRVTMPRQVILDTLSKTLKHLSAEEVYLAVRKVYPAIGLTTVYRTLEILVQMKIVSKFDFGDGRARYELIRESVDSDYFHHHHLVCTNCGRIVNYTDFINEEKEFLQKVERVLSEKYNFKITRHFIRFCGLCDKCRNINIDEKK